MPRKSAEELAGTWWRAKQQHGAGGRPKPPAWLSEDAAKTFKAIVGSRAPDLFGPGNLELLAHFCFTHHHATRLWSLASELPTDSPQARVLERRAVKMVELAASLGGKLALLPRHQHGHRSGVLNERYSGLPIESYPGDEDNIISLGVPDKW